MTVSVIVVGYGAEPQLTECLASVLSDIATGDEVVLVDNGVSSPPELPGVRVVDTGENLGFAGGAALGAATSTGDVLVFVNSDVVIQPGCLAALAAALEQPGVGMASGCVVLADEPERVNSSGNPVHVIGLSWAGGHGEPLAAHRKASDITSVTGALFAIRRDVWDRLGGLDPIFFMYYEDADLSLRCWLAGLTVRFVPEALATHAYDFARNPLKMHLLERNRLMSVTTVYPRELLMRVVPLLAITELPLLLLALRDGWARQRVAAWAWLLRRPGALIQRRRRVQALVTAPHALDARLTTTLTQSVLQAPPGLRLLDHFVGSYWKTFGPRRSPAPTREPTARNEERAA